MSKNHPLNDESLKAKNYHITFEQRPQYLYVYVTGKHDSLEISRQYWLEVAANCQKLNCKKVLIEEDIPIAISMGDMYQLGTDISQMGFRGVRIAFYDRYAEQNELNEFGELVTVNRGLYGKIFNDVNEAETWLLSE
ncbi:MAG: hypothetical protein JWN60_1865 [Acidobacteria bacterium]|nr:hypothetical protein [Acidobacteriota bacterium]